MNGVGAGLSAENDHNVERLLLRIEHAIYAGAEGVDRDERAEIMSAIREVLTSERVLDLRTRMARVEDRPAEQGVPDLLANLQASLDALIRPGDSS